MSGTAVREASVARMERSAIRVSKIRSRPGFRFCASGLRSLEFRDPAIKRLQEEIARRLGYELVGHRLELYARRTKGARGKGKAAR